MARDSKIKTSAPGSLMLFGEHAVLHGSLSLVTAISCRIHVTLDPINEKSIFIKSSLGNSQLHDASDYIIHGHHRFVIAALAEALPHFPERGFCLNIDSEFSDKIGLGSSSAVTVAVVAATLSWLGKQKNEREIFEHSFRAMRRVQGKGSGADIAASVYGGIIAYQLQSQQIRKLDKTFPITVVYSGSKTPTIEVIEKVEKQRQRETALFHSLFKSINQTTEQALKAIEAEDWETLGVLANKNQTYMEAMGVSNAALEEIICFLKKEETIFGAKISGAGLGDCVVGFGQMDSSLRCKCPYPAVPVEMSVTGVEKWNSNSQ